MEGLHRIESQNKNRILPGVPWGCPRAGLSCGCAREITSGREFGIPKIATLEGVTKDREFACNFPKIKLPANSRRQPRVTTDGENYRKNYRIFYYPFVQYGTNSYS